MNIAEALIHLRSRLIDVEIKESRNRPHWSQADIDAVATLVERPAAGEQIALARIEGRASQNGWTASGHEERLKEILAISRKALGFTA